MRIETTRAIREKPEKECPRPDLNRRQLDLQSSALPSELTRAGIQMLSLVINK